jgi:ubiquinone/menaquinone biosynthesis C-methylase UbiE
VARRNRWQERLELPLLLRALAVPYGARMLEVGCGRGVALPALDRLRLPRRLTGLDIDEALLVEAHARARRTATRCELVHGDVRAMPFADGTFDVVVDFGTLFHIARPEAALHEIARVLRPGGLLVHETKLSQLLSHPARARGRTVPWRAAPHLCRRRWVGLWAARVRAEDGGRRP